MKSVLSQYLAVCEARIVLSHVLPLDIINNEIIARVPVNINVYFAAELAARSKTKIGMRHKITSHIIASLLHCLVDRLIRRHRGCTMFRCGHAVMKCDHALNAMRKIMDGDQSQFMICEQQSRNIVQNWPELRKSGSFESQIAAIDKCLARRDSHNFSFVYPYIIHDYLREEMVNLMMRFNVKCSQMISLSTTIYITQIINFVAEEMANIPSFYDVIDRMSVRDGWRKQSVVWP